MIYLEGPKLYTWRFIIVYLITTCIYMKFIEIRHLPPRRRRAGESSVQFQTPEFKMRDVCLTLEWKEVEGIDAHEFDDRW